MNKLSRSCCIRLKSRGSHCQLYHFSTNHLDAKVRLNIKKTVDESNDTTTYVLTDENMKEIIDDETILNGPHGKDFVKPSKQEKEDKINKEKYSVAKHRALSLQKFHKKQQMIKNEMKKSRKKSIEYYEAINDYRHMPFLTANSINDDDSNNNVDNNENVHHLPPTLNNTSALTVTTINNSTNNDDSKEEYDDNDINNIDGDSFGESENSGNFGQMNESQQEQIATKKDTIPKDISIDKKLIITKDDVLKNLRKNFLKKKRKEKRKDEQIIQSTANNEIDNDIENIIRDYMPKLEYRMNKLKGYFTTKDINNMHEIVKYFDNNVVGHCYKFQNKYDVYSFINKFPYILKYDLNSQIIPRIDGLSLIFPNFDKYIILARAPQLISMETGFYLTKRDKLNKIFNFGKNRNNNSKNNSSGNEIKISPSFLFFLHKQPTILLNSILKSTYPKSKFLFEKCRSQHEFRMVLIKYPAILKIGWNRLARIEFLRSGSVPQEWKSAAQNPPMLKNIDLNYDDLDSDLNSDSNANNINTTNKSNLDRMRYNMNDNSGGDKSWKQTKKEIRDWSELKEEVKHPDDEKIDFVEKTSIEREWYLQYPAVLWAHSKMLFHFPKYINYLQEMTLRCKRNELWTMNDLKNIDSREMELIVGNGLKRKYILETKRLLKEKIDFNKTKSTNEKVKIRDNMILPWHKKQRKTKTR